MTRVPLALPSALAAVALLGSCGLFRTVLDAPNSVARAVMPAKPESKLQPIETLHPRLLGFADYCAQRGRMVTEDFAVTAKTPAARMQAIRWRLQFSRAVFQAATGPSPLSGLLDTLVVVATGAEVFERRGYEKTWGDAAKPVRAALASLETKAWEIVADYLTQAQVDELRQALAAWKQRTAQTEIEELEELPDFRQVSQIAAQSSGTSGGTLTNFLSIDPLQGLEPAARELALTRQFAERMLFWAERLPLQVEDQIALGTLEMQRLPEVQETMTSLTRATKAAESVAATADRLPESLSKEREAAIRQAAAELGTLRDTTVTQFSDALRAQQRDLLAQLDAARQPVESVLGDTRKTIESAQTLSKELTGTIQAFDAMMGRFGPKPGAEPAPPPAAGAPPGKPFDINDYGRTATDIAAAARELREAIVATDAALPRVQQTLEGTIDTAFRRGLQLGLGLIAAGAAAAFALRLGRRRPPAASA